MKAFILLFAALIVIVTICETRPLVFVAIQNSTSFDSESNEIGNVVGYYTIRKGIDSRRLRLFGIHSVQDRIREAWLSDDEGNRYASLRIGNDTSSQTFDGRYFYGDFYMNQTETDLLLDHKLKVVISTTNYKDGIIGGYLMSMPFVGFAYMDGDQIVPPISTARRGFAIAVIEPATTTSSELVENIEMVATQSTMGVSIVQNAGIAREAGFYGEAGPGVNGVFLHNLTNKSARYAYEFGMKTVAEDFGLIDGITYAQIFTTHKPNGALRGDFDTILKRSRPLEILSHEVIGGSTSVSPSSLDALRRARNIGSANPIAGSVLGCQTNSTFHYAANFVLQAPVNRRNSELLRGFTLAVSLKQSAAATWNFALLDIMSGEHRMLGSFSRAAGVFEAGVAHYFVNNTDRFMSGNKNFVLHVSTSATASAELLIDQLQVRAHVANGVSSDKVKAIIDNGSILSYRD